MLRDFWTIIVLKLPGVITLYCFQCYFGASDLSRHCIYGHVHHIYTVNVGFSQSFGSCLLPRYFQYQTLSSRAWTTETESRVLTRQRNGELGQKLSQIAHFSKVPVGQAIPCLNLRLLLCQIWKKISDARTFPFEEWGSQTGLDIFDLGWEHH